MNYLKMCLIVILTLAAVTAIMPAVAQEPMLDRFSRPANSLESIVYELDICYRNSCPEPNIAFENVTGDAGITYVGQSWGAAWGDFNDDGYPDLWTSNHNYCPSLYLNLGDGTFDDILDEVISDDLCDYAFMDAHGSAWADFDNDGDQDLIQLIELAPISSLRANRLYENNGGVLVNRAVELGVDNLGNRGRMPLWLDHNRDGLLDLIVPTTYTNPGNVPTKLFEQAAGGGFVDVSSAVGFPLLESVNSVHFADMDGDGSCEVMPEVFNTFPKYTFSTQNQPWMDIGPSIAVPITNHVRDAAIGDLSGNLMNDLFLVAGDKQNDIVQFDDTTIRARLAALDTEMGFTFTGGDNITISPNPRWSWTTGEMFIGASGVNPPTKEFTISRTDPMTSGIMPHSAGTDVGLYVGWDDDNQVWRFLVSNKGNANYIVSSDSLISGLDAVGVDLAEQDRPDRLVLNVDGGFVDNTTDAGFTIPSSGRNVVAADFDNDMDLDLYIVSTGAVTNRSNILYENNGDGTFSVVPGAGGAAGTTSMGRGDTVATADFDRDGFIDLAVTNGKSKPPFDQGPLQIFRNAGNSNNWLEIDLEGVQSNRNGIGARVLSTSGGVTQIRQQNGGIHYRTQNHSRVHFGLGSNTSTDLTIEWPTGITQTLQDVPANQIIQVLEPVSPDLAGKPPSAAIASAKGIMLWKDSFDGPYRLRAKGGGPKTTYSIKLVSSEPFTSLSTGMLEADDIWTKTESGFSLDAVVSSGDKRVSFSLPGGAIVLLSVENEGSINPRQIYVGANESRLTPAGWIVPYSVLPTMPAVVGGASLGQFAGSTLNPGEIAVRSNSDGSRHYSGVTVVSSQPLLNTVWKNVEANDIARQTATSIHVYGEVKGRWNGMDIVADPASDVGLAFTQDELFQPASVNPHHGSFGEPNAYWLPIADPYGAPEYDTATEAGIFVWKTPGGAWSLRVSGASATRFTGQITADVPVTSVVPVGVELVDIVDSSTGKTISFSLDTTDGHGDGFDFSFPDGATIYLSLVSPSRPESLLRVGKKRWPIDELPLNLSGWK